MPNCQSLVCTNRTVAPTAVTVASSSCAVFHGWRCLVLRLAVRADNARTSAFWPRTDPVTMANRHRGASRRNGRSPRNGGSGRDGGSRQHALSPHGSRIAHRRPGAAHLSRGGEAMVSPHPYRRPGPLALVAVGGTIGTLVRSTLSAAFPALPGAIPWSTFWINVTGAFLLGALLRLLSDTGTGTGTGTSTSTGSREANRLKLRWCLGTGLLGGYTTYSTFVVESITLARQDQVAAAATYDVLSLLVGYAAAWGGWYGVARRRGKMAGKQRA